MLLCKAHINGFLTIFVGDIFIKSYDLETNKDWVKLDTCMSGELLLKS